MSLSLPAGGATGGLTATPDDGTRLSAVAPWDEATRPHLAPDGPIDPGSDRGRAAAQSMLDVHTELRTDLEQVRRLVAEVTGQRLRPDEARAMLQQMALRVNRWVTGANCAAYCNLVAQHHFGEDVEIFPYLRRRDAGLAPVLDRLETEHVVIHELLDGVDRALVALVSDAETAEDDGLAAVVDRLTDALLSHLSYEEHELLGPMAKAFG